MTEKRGEMIWLSMAQRAALRAVEAMASRLDADANNQLTMDLQGCGCTEEMFEDAMRSISWRDWGSYEETLQHLKQLWHVFVPYGSPARPSAA